MKRHVCEILGAALYKTSLTTSFSGMYPKVVTRKKECGSLFLRPGIDQVLQLLVPSWEDNKNRPGPEWQQENRYEKGTAAEIQCPVVFQHLPNSQGKKKRIITGLSCLWGRTAYLWFIQVFIQWIFTKSFICQVQCRMLKIHQCMSNR